MKVSKETIVRTALLVVLLLNQVLTMCGLNPLPFSEDQIYEFFSLIASIVVTIWAWWKNNSFTPAAIQADEYMKEMKKADTEEED